jgi:hypothetical protein
MSSNNTIRFLLLILSTCFLLGCGPGGPDIASVEGTVTMDGKPLANAMVLFIPPEGRPAGARTNAEGKYELNFSGGRKGTMPGLNKVRISTQAEAYTDDSGKSHPGSKETIPEQFNQLSKLEFQVEPGKRNIADFQLESKGKVRVSSGY